MRWLLEASPANGRRQRAWRRTGWVSDNIRSIYQKGEPDIQQIAKDEEKVTFIIESGERRTLLVCIGGVNHLLSSKEIESFNTRLDTEGYYSVTVISLGKIT